MPQLLSRMDDMNWLTPSIAEILEQGATPPGGDGSMRDQQITLQKRFAELETPARITNIRPFPSYTLFIAKPEMIGRLGLGGNRRTVTSTELRKSLGQIAEEHPEWKLGYLPNVQDDDETVGILLRTENHSPLSLRRMLVRTSFRDNRSSMAFVAGNTLEQRLLVHDLANIGNLLVIGSDNAKQHFMQSMLLTFTSMNTPSELRLVITGEETEYHKRFTYIPHAIGRIMMPPKEGKRLLEGLNKELTRRQGLFEEYGFADIDEYNARLKEEHETIIPRILVVIDSMSSPSWQEVRDVWVPPLTNLLEDNGTHGIHIIMTADKLQAPDVPGAFEDIIPLKIIMRSSATSQTDTLKNFHNSLLRFVDAIIVDTSEEEHKVTPVELCAITDQEIQNAVNYWREAANVRNQETESVEVSGKTGVTGVLKRVDTGTLAVRVETEKTVNVAQETPKHSEPPRIETHATHVQMPSFQQVQALAAYLGWIGVGPLQDVFGMSPQDAHKALAVLKREGIVESTDSPTPRFIRLKDYP